MKRMKKMVSLMLTLVMVIAMAAPAFAGSITIKGTENVPASEKEFMAYKILDVEFPNDKDGNTDYSRMAYKVPDALKDFYAEEFELDSSKASFDQDVVTAIAKLRAENAGDNADANGYLRAFMSRALAAAKGAGISGVAGLADGDDYKISDLASGYYVVEDMAPTDGSDYVVSALMLDTTTPDAEITIKTDKPSIDKKIVEGEGDDAVETNANNAAMGEAVSYKVTSKVPDMTHYNTYTFTVTDTFSKGLTYNHDLKVTVGGTEIDNTGESFYKEEVTKTDGTTTLTVDFKDFKKNFGAEKGKDIVITYTATVNKDAVIGSAGNKNSVKLTYSNNPNKVDEATSTPEVDVFTYVTGIQITKVDAANTNMKLTGAQFKIEGEGLQKALVKGYEFVEDPNGEFYKDGDVYTTTEVAGSERYTKKEVNKDEESTVSVNYVAEVGEDGILSLDGLCEGIYTITEVKAPNGYNILKNPIKIQIKCNTDSVSADRTNCSWLYRKADANEEFKSDDSDYVSLENSPVIAFDVKNTTGVELPSTGGIGTTIFYVLGSILLIGAGVLLVTKKKMAGRE